MLMAHAAACRADTFREWKTECVGRYQVSVPGQVEFALAIPQAFTDEVPSPYRFNDGSTASHSASPILVGQPATHADFDALQKKVEQANKGERENLLQKAKEWTIDSLKEDSRREAESIIPYPVNMPNTFAWQYQGGITIYMHRDGRILMNDVSARKPIPIEQGNTLTAQEMVDISLATQRLSRFIATFRSRPLYSLPQPPGLCIPYGFIADDGKGAHDIGVTMRLKDHPDVEIFFEDRTAQDYGIKQPASSQERSELSMLWEGEAQDAKRVDLQFPGYHTVWLDGREGTGSFVEITRRDGSKDYGYAAVVNGDFISKRGAPQLMLYVIRTASRAKGAPVGKSGLKDIAYKIVASVKRREAMGETNSR
jgi:hypothetical protein